jgi:hypothetical protein
MRLRSNSASPGEPSNVGVGRFDRAPRDHNDQVIVTVHIRSEQTRYSGISAFGIGHIHRSLVLVPEDGTQPIEIEPNQWTRVEIVQLETPPLKEPPGQALPGTRRIIVDEE